MRCFLLLLPQTRALTPAPETIHQYRIVFRDSGQSARQRQVAPQSASWYSLWCLLRQDAVLVVPVLTAVVTAVTLTMTHPFP